MNIILFQLNIIKKDLVIQTPKLYNYYGINNKFKNKYIDLSFQNLENDDNLKYFF